MLGVGRHPLLKVRIEDDVISSSRWRTGALLRARYGLTPNLINDFPGYVFTSDPDLSPTVGGGPVRLPVRPPSMDVVAVGITHPFKAKGVREWTNTTTWRILQDLGQRHRIDTKFDRVGKKRSIVKQDGRSEWQMLRDLAEDDGLLLFEQAGALNLRDPRLLEDDTRSAARILHVAAMRSFTPVTGDLSAVGPSGAEYVSRGSDFFVASSISNVYRSADTNRPRIAITEPVMDDVGSPSEARESVEAAERRGRFVYHAKMELGGDPSILPGRSVYIEGAGEVGSGYWIVLHASHEFSEGKYLTRAELGRAAPRRRRRPPRIVNGRRIVIDAAGDQRGAPATPQTARVLQNQWVSR